MNYSASAESLIDPSHHFRYVSKPKCLQTHTILSGHAQDHFPKAYLFVRTPFCLENSLFKGQPHMAPQVDQPEAKCSSIDPLSGMFSPRTGPLG